MRILILLLLLSCQALAQVGSLVSLSGSEVKLTSLHYSFDLTEPKARISLEATLVNTTDRPLDAHYLLLATQARPPVELDGRPLPVESTSRGEFYGHAFLVPLSPHEEARLTSRVTAAGEPAFDAGRRGYRYHLVVPGDGTTEFDFELPESLWLGSALSLESSQPGHYRARALTGQVAFTVGPEADLGFALALGGPMLVFLLASLVALRCRPALALTLAMLLSGATYQALSKSVWLIWSTEPAVDDLLRWSLVLAVTGAAVVTTAAGGVREPAERG